MSLSEPSIVCTLKTITNIVGDVSLAWSEDNCIAVGTTAFTSLFDLNPFDTAKDAVMHFKTQTIPVPSKPNYKDKIQGFLDEFDDRRKSPFYEILAPDYDIYRSYLDPSLCQMGEDGQRTGIKSLGFSSLGCSKSDGTLFAFLTVDHCLQIYSKKYDGYSVRWNKLKDISDVLIQLLKQNKGCYPLMPLPSDKSGLKLARVTRYAACIDHFKWTSIYRESTNQVQCVYLITSTLTNFVIVWKLDIPVGEASKVEAIAFVKAFDDGAVSCIAVHPSIEDKIQICVGNVNGKIVSIAVNHDGHEMSRRDIWKDDDELSVHCMDWQLLQDEPGCSLLVAAKSFNVISLRIDDPQQPSYCVVNPHALNVSSLVPLDSFSWLAAWRDGSVGKIKYSHSDNSLSYEAVIVEKEFSESVISRGLVHSAVVSPSKTFMAVLRSKHSCISTVMADPSSHVDITALCTGTKSFEILCNQSEMTPPGMDAVESVRLHLTLKEINNDPSEMELLAACVKHFIDTPSTRATLKWCLTKVGQGVFQTEVVENALWDLERNITIRQMVRILEWLPLQPKDSWIKFPVLGILLFLKTNRSYLDASQIQTLEQLERHENVARQSDEICEVTGEPLLFSGNGRHAIAEVTRLEWPRCCLTFRALQGFHQRRCDISNASSVDIDTDLQDLLHGRCLYTGLPMM